MSNFIHFLYCPFTGLGIRRGYRGDAWLKNRIRIFKEYTLRSMMSQHDRDFIWWASWRKEDRHNPIVQDLARTLEGLRGFRYVFTYGGLAFYDDKHPPQHEEKALIERLENTLPDLKEFCLDDTPILMTIQPSDDCYWTGAVEEIKQKFEKHKKAKAAGYTKGYIMNYNNGHIAEYNPTTLPPFFTIKFSKKKFFDPVEHVKFTGPYRSHEHISKCLPFVELEGRGFLVGTHGENISTIFNHPYQGELLGYKEADAIKIIFGIWKSELITIKKPMRILARKILNLMPFNGIIRSIYHKLPTKMQKL